MLPAALLLCASQALAQAASDPSPFIGRWQIDLAQTKMGRMGPNAAPNLTRSPSFTFVFSAAGPKLRMETYEQFPQPAPTYTVSIVADGKQRACEATNPCHAGADGAADRRYSYVLLDPHLMLRRLYLNGVVAEYTTYAVSSDGKVFTMMAWSAATPQWQNLQVFEKQP